MRRSQRREASHGRIVAIASRRLRAEGLRGAGVAPVMREAGLTHGGFYAHFADKNDLVTAALEAAMAEGRSVWFNGLEGLPPEEAIKLIVGRYLSRTHRDAPASGCAIAALGSEIARAGPKTRQAFEKTLRATLAALELLFPEGNGRSCRERALATVALCAGGILLARMVADPELSDAILRACRRAAVAEARG